MPWIQSNSVSARSSYIYTFIIVLQILEYSINVVNTGATSCSQIIFGILFICGYYRAVYYGNKLYFVNDPRALITADSETVLTSPPGCIIAIANPTLFYSPLFGEY